MYPEGFDAALIGIDEKNARLNGANFLITFVEKALDRGERVYQPRLDEYRQALLTSSHGHFDRSKVAASITVAGLVLGEVSKHPLAKNLSRGAAMGAAIYASFNLWIGVTKRRWRTELADRDSFAEKDLAYELDSE